MPGMHASQDSPAQDDTVAYIARTAGDLKRMAEKHDLPMLAYLIDMVRLEANLHLRKIARNPDGQG